MHTVKYTNSIDFHCLEDLRENSVDIALVHMGKEECKPYHAFSGTRDEYIIHFVLSGNGFYSTNGNTWPIGPGQMFLIYPEEPVVYCADKNTPWTYVWVGFKGLGTDTILKHCGFSKSHLILPAPALDKYIGCFDALFEHTTLSFSDRLYRESILLKLMAILSDHHTHLVLKGNQRKNVYENNAYVALAVDYINEMYMQNISVLDIADRIGITRSHLNHSFQKELNISVQRFLIDFRMHKAANLLVSTTMSVKEIANQVGYNDQLVFSKAFKKKFGMSPNNYRTHTDEMEIRKNRP
ncbi:MAG: AraC family transcriptional regulator [Clostridiales bacterium]|nr:AraC family transcriptional regulator [Clostridiales bacterium]